MHTQRRQMTSCTANNPLQRAHRIRISLSFVCVISPMCPKETVQFSNVNITNSCTMARTKLPRTTTKRPRKQLACMSVDVARSSAYYPPHGEGRDWTDSEDESTSTRHDAAALPIAPIGGFSDNSGTNHNGPCTLEHLSANSDVWESICAYSSGNAVVCLSQVSKQVRQATVQTPAFVCLAGLDCDGFTVPWQDPANIMGVAELHKGWNPSKHFRIRSHSTTHALDRELAAQHVVASFLSAQPDCNNGEWRFRGPTETLNRNADFEYGSSTNFYYGAPARPSSACSDYAFAHEYVYQLHNPCERVMQPFVFPQAAHRRASARIAQYLIASPASPGSDTSSCDDSETSEYAEYAINWIRRRYSVVAEETAPHSTSSDML